VLLVGLSGTQGEAGTVFKSLSLAATQPFNVIRGAAQLPQLNLEFHPFQAKHTRQTGKESCTDRPFADGFRLNIL
jgi:hypothetical protein